MEDDVVGGRIIGFAKNKSGDLEVMVAKEGNIYSISRRRGERFML